MSICVRESETLGTFWFFPGEKRIKRALRHCHEVERNGRPYTHDVAHSM